MTGAGFLPARHPSGCQSDNVETLKVIMVQNLHYLSYSYNISRATLFYISLLYLFIASSQRKYAKAQQKIITTS